MFGTTLVPLDEQIPPRGRLIAVERAVAASPERVFDFLADLRNHWRLERRFLELDELGEDGGTIRLEGAGPVADRSDSRPRGGATLGGVAGRADLSGGTVGLVSWDIRPFRSGSIVRLSAEVPEASLWDRLFLALGGRAWFGRPFRRALENLDTVDEQAAPQHRDSPATSSTLW